MQTERLRRALALDEFERTIDEKVGLPLRSDARSATHMQNMLQVNVVALVDGIAKEFDLESSDIFGGCMAILSERMEKALEGVCDEFRVEVFKERGKEVGRKVTYYKWKVRRSA